MKWKNEELYIITLTWKNTLKKLYLGGEKGPSGKEKFQKALMDIEHVGDGAQSWEDFLDKCIEIFRKYGFERVDL